MRKPAITLFSVAALLFAAPPLRAQQPEPRKITVSAKKYAFSPSTIEMRVGETVQLIFESEDTTHGFSCKDLTSEKVKFKKGEPATLTLKAEKPGTYKFKCAHFCGLGHLKMKGKIVVTP
ncbi:MAG: cupredoxin domain-containing protein [Thermoanaerobaculia bacterium]